MATDAHGSGSRATTASRTSASASSRSRTRTGSRSSSGTHRARTAPTTGTSCRRPARRHPAAAARPAASRRALPSPTPTFEMLDPVNNWAYVTVPVDFRAGGNSWRTVSVTASIGPVWATVTAQPVLMTFDPGDPNGGRAGRVQWERTGRGVCRGGSGRVLVHVPQRVVDVAVRRLPLPDDDDHRLVDLVDVVVWCRRRARSVLDLGYGAAGGG